MVDIPITPANVRPAERGVTLEVHEAAGAISAGQPVFLDATNNSKATPAVNNTTDAAANVRGIAMSDTTADGQFVIIQRSGKIAIGGTVSAGADYYLSSNAGGIMPDGDKATGMRIVELFYAENAEGGKVDIRNTGITVP